MRGASEQNMLLMSIVDQQIKLEHNSANSLGDIAVAASGIASSSPSKDSREQEIARIAATAASNHSASDLAPGRILNQLGAEMGVEALRRLRTAAECRKVLIDNRLSPMACDFTESLTVEAGKGVGLLKIGRDIDLYVRDMFGAYDAAARHAQREGQEAVEVGADVWLLNLRWRLACVWQGSLWKETTRRFRGQFEALHKIEHNRRIIWANSFDVRPLLELSFSLFHMVIVFVGVAKDGGEVVWVGRSQAALHAGAGTYVEGGFLVFRSHSLRDDECRQEESACEPR